MFQGEVAEHVVSFQPSAKASTDFATFPVSSFIKVKYKQHTDHFWGEFSRCLYDIYIFCSFFCFSGQGGKAGRNSVCGSCCNPLHPWAGASSPPGPVSAAAAKSALPAHGLRMKSSGTKSCLTSQQESVFCLFQLPYYHSLNYALRFLLVSRNCFLYLPCFYFSTIKPEAQWSSSVDLKPIYA